MDSPASHDTTPTPVQTCDLIAKLNTAHSSLSGQVGVPSPVCSLGDGICHTLFRCLLSAQTCMHGLTQITSWSRSHLLMDCAAMHCSNSACFAVLAVIVPVQVYRTFLCDLGKDAPG